METATSPSIQPLQYLQAILTDIETSKQANESLFDKFGIVVFFENDTEFSQFKGNKFQETIDNSEKIEYGDFQTNSELTDRIVKILVDKDVSPQIVIEPTVGKGNFIVSALKYFEKVEKVFAIEIYKPYLWRCKLAIIEFYLHNERESKPEIHLIHDSVFSVDFDKIANKCSQKEFLILGNPPWVTNSKLGMLNAKNLPVKTNFKNHNGLDALTGKSNFDISEYICYLLIRTFQNNKGNIALLVKNTVIKNIVFDQYKNKLSIANIEKYNIDSKKEFNASVDAALFYAKLDQSAEFQILEKSVYHPNNDKKNILDGLNKNSCQMSKDTSSQKISMGNVHLNGDRE